MKILIAGNSQASCLKLAIDQDISLTKGHEVHFFVFPGAYGPYFDIVDGKLKIQSWGVLPKFPPKSYPESVENTPIDNYDCIAVSALGYIDGGYLYQHAALVAGLLHRFKIKTDIEGVPLISEPCAREIVHSVLAQQAGFKFLDRLRKNYQKTIVVQPFPRVSTVMESHQEWVFNRFYNDPLAACQFFNAIRDQFFAEACATANAIALPYPSCVAEGDLFTPAALMRPADGLHPTAIYGAAVMQQIIEAAERLHLSA